jgi:hypothetical protein
MLNSKPSTFCDPTSNWRKISIKSCTLIAYKPQWGIACVQSFDLLRKASSGQELRHSLATTTLGNCSHLLRTIQYARRAPKCKSLSSIWSIPKIQSLSNIRSRPKMQIPLQHPKWTQNAISSQHPKSTQIHSVSLCLCLSVSQSHKC